MTLPPNKAGGHDFRYDALPMIVPECGGDPLAVQFKRDCEAALHNPEIDPIEAADGYRDTPPEDDADELSLAKGEIAWLREFVRRARVNHAELVEASRELLAWYGPFNPTKHPPEINGAWLRLQAAVGDAQ